MLISQCLQASACRTGRLYLCICTPGGSIITFSRNTASVLFFYLSDLNRAERQKKKKKKKGNIRQRERFSEGAALLGARRGFVLVSSGDKSMDVWCLLLVESAHTQRLSGLEQCSTLLRMAGLKVD